MAMNANRKITGQPLVKIKVQADKFNQHINRMLRGMSAPQAAAGFLKMAFDTVDSIATKTPVDTGRCRAAWYPAMDKMAGLMGITSRYKANSSEQKAGYALGSVRMQLRGLRKTVTIINAVSYAMVLEYGWSTQAPYGMVRVTMQLFARKAPAAILAQLTAMWKGNGVPKWSHWRAAKEGPFFA